ncbi:MAG: hypothetical protein HZC01_03495 [Candidatus Kerfeldbacteria bacterium]|nr:hypothetical protein [Candidatus Kerfeldbacteria bacterium]
MNLPVIQHNDGREFLKGGSLVMLRAEALDCIKNDMRLTPQLKVAAIRELDFLLEYERLRRVRIAHRKFREEERELVYQALIRRQEVVNLIRLAQAQTARAIEEIKRDIAHWRIEVKVQLQRLRPKDEVLKQARNEILKLKLKHRLEQMREQELHRSLEEQTLKRAALMGKVQRDFPDLAEELVERYDQMAYQSSGGSQS